MYQEVTNIIIEALEAGVKPWSEPQWKGEAAPRIVMPLRHNSEAYKGINVVILWSIAMKKNYVSPHWMTYKQAKELGGQVKKGEKSSPVFYAGKLKIEDEGEAAASGADDEEKFIHYMKAYSVFNVEQIDDLPENYYYRPAPWPTNPDLERSIEAENFITQTGAAVHFGGDSAFYSPKNDSISMPALEDFKSASAYYAVLLHELTHWTGHKSRLDRGFAPIKKESEEYAFEELIAELGAAFLCADTGVMSDIRGDHAHYIDFWLKILKEDKKAIFRAASKAQKAADFLHELQADHDNDPSGQSIDNAPPTAEALPVCENAAYNSMQEAPPVSCGDKTPEIFETVWRDDWLKVRLQIKFTREKFSNFDHLEIEAIEPEKIALPITTTGYRSHFCPTGEIDAAGGAIEAARSLLDIAAQSNDWKSQQSAARQGSLF